MMHILVVNAREHHTPMSQVIWSTVLVGWGRVTNQCIRPVVWSGF